MFDSFSPEGVIFDFDEVADHLMEHGLETSPSELHGCLCGQLSAGASSEPEAGLAALGQALNIEVYGELAEQLMQLYKVTAAALEDDEFDFYPLLPDDERDIDERTLALSLWCRAYLTGYAHVKAGAGKAGQMVPADSAEILKDFAAIAQAQVDEDIPEEESEASYAELVEYLRFAALNVYADSVIDLPEGASEDGHPPSLH